MAAPFQLQTERLGNRGRLHVASAVENAARGARDRASGYPGQTARVQSVPAWRTRVPPRQTRFLQDAHPGLDCRWSCRPPPPAVPAARHLPVPQRPGGNSDCSGAGAPTRVHVPWCWPTPRAQPAPARPGVPAGAGRRPLDPARECRRLRCGLAARARAWRQQAGQSFIARPDGGAPRGPGSRAGLCAGSGPLSRLRSRAGRRMATVCRGKPEPRPTTATRSGAATPAWAGRQHSVAGRATNRAEPWRAAGTTGPPAPVRNIDAHCKVWPSCVSGTFPRQARKVDGVATRWSTTSTCGDHTHVASRRACRHGAEAVAPAAVTVSKRCGPTTTLSMPGVGAKTPLVCGLHS